MRQAIINWFKTPDTSTFTNLTRASIVGISTGLLGANIVVPPATTTIGFAAATTDAAQEELIGKIVNLTKVGGKVDGFTIIILAQTIKDVGGDGFDVSMTKYPASGSSSTKIDCRIGQFDAMIIDVTDSSKNIYFDEITAEQKILVRGYRGIDGSIKITSFQYID